CSIGNAAQLQAIGLNLHSVHTEAGYNDQTLGLFANWTNGFTIGTYQSSESNRFGNGTRMNAYVGRLWETDPVSTGAIDWRFGVLAGAVYGYMRSPILPLGLLTVSADYGHHGLRLSFVPPLGGRNGFPGVLTLSYEYRF
ncbi:MAG: hypothetical protein ACREQ5_29210, partial [Candidatus Dormibacteria bacterium]